MLDAWIEWKQRCAIEACSVDTRKRLRAFARSRFRRCVARALPRAAPGDHEDPWHLLESHLAVKQTRQGKRYKDWLFARVSISKDSPLDVIQGGASLVMRDVARAYLQAEAPARDTVSLHQPLVTRDGRSWTLLDILPAGLDPASEACLREYEQLAGRHARAFMKDLSRRDQIVLLSKDMGVSLAHPLVEKGAGARKSVLNETYRGILSRIAAALSARYAGDDPESVLTLALLTVQCISAQLFLQKKSEKAFGFLFTLVKDRNHEPAQTASGTCVAMPPAAS